MKVCELIKLFREEEKDNIPDYLWSDSLLVTYLNKGLMEFAKKTLSIYDEITEYIPANEVNLFFDPVILLVLNAFIEETQDKLIIASANSPYSYTKALLLNVTTHSMKLSKPYSIPVNIRLRVIRKPLNTLKLEDDIPDIEESDVDILLYYMKYKAYQVQDADIINIDKSAFNLSLFKDSCQAIREDNLLRRRTEPIIMERMWWKL